VRERGKERKSVGQNDFSPALPFVPMRTSLILMNTQLSTSGGLKGKIVNSAELAVNLTEQVSSC